MSLTEPFVSETLTSLLDYQAKKSPNKTLFTFLKDGENITEEITYSQFYDRVIHLAAQLKSQTQPSNIVLILAQPGIDFVVAIFGCLYANLIAVPAYPPHAKKIDERLISIVNSCNPTLAICDNETFNKLVSVSELPSNFLLPPLLNLVSNNNELSSDITFNDVLPSDVAILQYTSGSTSEPKAVTITHKNLIHNLALIKERFHLSTETRGLTWLPPYHDMGLIGFILGTIYCGSYLVIVPPTSIIQKPQRWLATITKFKITGTGGPNFGFELCVNKIQEDDLVNYNLSTWNVAYNGAEPVSANTINKFSEKFAKCGFSKQTFSPCYGLAESTLLVTNSQPNELPFSKFFDSQSLMNGKALVCSNDIDKKLMSELVSSGRLFNDPDVKIINPENEHFEEMPTGNIGEIVIESKSITAGYWNNDEATKSLFITNENKKYLRTGDLGFIYDNQLFVTGRLKDLIIIRGKNHYPQDIEQTAELAHQSLQTKAAAAFTIHIDNIESLVLCIELKRSSLNTDYDEIINAIKLAVLEKHHISLHSVVLLQPVSIPKTTSGKIRRSKCKLDYLSNTLKSLKEYTFTEASEIQFAKNSSQKANELIIWLREYASKRINSFIIDERRTIPPYIVLDFGNVGLLGMQVEEQYGGLNLSNTDALRVVEQLAAIDLTLASFIGVHQALGTRPIKNFANKNTQKTLLPYIATGRELAGFAITEPFAGSNPLAIKAVAVPDGANRWKLYGEKEWIGLGSWAGSINVFVHLLDENNQSLGITGFVLKQGIAGLIQGEEALTMGVRGMIQNKIYLDGVSVTSNDLLGELGKGMLVAQDAMMYGRLGIAVMCLGGLKKCAQLGLNYAQKRNISTGKLIDNVITINTLNEINASIFVIDKLVYFTSKLLDKKINVPDELFMICKIVAPEMLWKGVDKLMQLLGGRGYIETNLVPQLMRDARLFRIFEGPTETLLMAIGSRILHSPSNFISFIEQHLSTSSSFIEDIKSLSNPSLYSSNTKDIFKYNYGECICYGFILALLKSHLVSNSEHYFNNSLNFIEEKYQTLKSNLGKTSSLIDESIKASDIELMIQSYHNQIGTIEQTLVSPLIKTDSLLLVNQEVKQIIETPKINGNAQKIKSNNSLNLVDTLNEPITYQLIKEKIEDFFTNELSIQLLKNDTTKPIITYGLDSLSIVEFQTFIEKQFNVEIPNESFYNKISLENIITEILNQNLGKTTDAITNHSTGLEFSNNDLVNNKNYPDLSLFFFADELNDTRNNQYDLLLKASQFADNNNFLAVWLPERHFHNLGGLYPNPSITASAIATITQNVRLRAGSIVLPLHNPIRVAEDWAMVDNLSDGRIDLSFTPGWSANDYTLAPDNYSSKLEITFKGIETIKTLWRGEKVKVENGNKEIVEIGIFPLPKNKNQQIWLTCTKEKERFVQAGKMGANILTALLMQSPDELSQNIEAYLQAREQAGYNPKEGKVTLMLHTFIGEEINQVKSIVREPLMSYIKSSIKLWKLTEKPLENLSEDEQLKVLNLALDKYINHYSLIGTESQAEYKLQQFKQMGVNEIACLIDFGLSDEEIFQSLNLMKNLIPQSNTVIKPIEENTISQNHYFIS